MAHLASLAMTVPQGCAMRPSQRESNVGRIFCYLGKPWYEVSLVARHTEGQLHPLGILHRLYLLRFGAMPSLEIT